MSITPEMMRKSSPFSVRIVAPSSRALAAIRMSLKKPLVRSFDSSFLCFRNRRSMSAAISHVCRAGTCNRCLTRKRLNYSTAKRSLLCRSRRTDQQFMSNNRAEDKMRQVLLVKLPKGFSEHSIRKPVDVDIRIMYERFSRRDRAGCRPG